MINASVYRMDGITENFVTVHLGIRVVDTGDITAGLGQVEQIHLLVNPHNYRCSCKSVATVSNIYAGDMQL